jgi:ComF family protein
MKDHGQLIHGRMLSELLIELLAKDLPSNLNSTTMTTLPEVLIPVPLHVHRLRQRGYNQALEIARHLSRQLQIPLDTYSCQRVLDTPHQQGLSATERKRNLKQAFRVNKPLGYRHVALIDDVMTTGTTLNILAALLRRQGVERIDNWCLARTPHHH